MLTPAIYLGPEAVGLTKVAELRRLNRAATFGLASRARWLIFQLYG
jgi:hypothetical protein